MRDILTHPADRAAPPFSSSRLAVGEKSSGESSPAAISGRQLGTHFPSSENEEGEGGVLFGDTGGGGGG